MAFCKMEEYTIDSFELLYSGAVDKIKSHKSNLNLSKLNTQPGARRFKRGLRSYQIRDLVTCGVVFGFFLTSLVTVARASRAGEQSTSLICLISIILQKLQ